MFYIKNSYEYFEDSETHYLADSPQIKRAEANEKIASHVILNQLKSNPSLYNAISYFEDNFDEYVDDFYVFEDNFREFLFKNHYIVSNEYGKGFWDYVYEINTYEELKSYMDEEGIDSSGTKEDLIRRIKERNLYDDFNEFEFKMSSEGEKYFESIEWIKYYLVYLDSFDLIEFEEFYNGSDNDFKDASLKFLNEHLKLALKRNDFNALFDAQSSKAMYYVINKDIVSALNEEMKLFIVRLNPTCDGDDLVFHMPTERTNIHNLKVLIKLCEIDNLKSLFKANWDSLEYEKIWFDENTSFDIFTKALKAKKPDELNRDIENQYFEE